MTTDPDKIDSLLLRTMTLLATLTAAAEVKHAMQERRSGQDPSTQETARVARRYLVRAEDEVRTSVLQLRASLVVSQSDEDFISSRVRRFNDLVRIRRLSHLLQRMHQRLLSLYPSVSEGLAEEARVMYANCRQLLDTPAFDEDAEAFVLQGLGFCGCLRIEIGVRSEE